MGACSPSPVVSPWVLTCVPSAGPGCTQKGWESPLLRYRGESRMKNKTCRKTGCRKCAFPERGWLPCLQLGPATRCATTVCNHGVQLPRATRERNWAVQPRWAIGVWNTHWCWAQEGLGCLWGCWCRTPAQLERLRTFSLGAAGRGGAHTVPSLLPALVMDVTNSPHLSSG